ncbi:Alpha/Beta hydrolase protein [Hypoxylon sp. FL1857]|nr:Alpha/Beta hydrolase protein [Hypoxylon sp. FL1857]
MYETPSLTIWDYISLPLAAMQIVIALASASFKAGFRGRDGAATVKRHVLYNGMRAVVENISIRQYQALNPTTSEAYRAFAKQKRFKPDVIEVADGTLGFWMGNREAHTILVWFHGGGYAFAAGQEYMDFLHSLVMKVQSENSELAVFVIQYDLAPHGKYPRQLEQASATVGYLTRDLGKSYSQLLVGGDSAGGNLTIALLSHLAHPHSKIPALGDPGRGFKGALLLSPWVTFDQSAEAFDRNKMKDCLSLQGLKSWSRALMGSAPDDNYNTPLDAPSDWWQDIKAGKVLILAGEDELLVDDIMLFAEKLKEHNAQKVEILVSSGECYNPPISERQLGIHGKPNMYERKLYQWITDQI